MTTNTAKTGNNYLDGSAICPVAQKTGTLTLTSAEIEELYQRLKNELVWAALHKPYEKDYCWPLYDKVVKAGDLKVHDSHDEYEYWRDWMDKNRDDLYEDRYADREENDE